MRRRLLLATASAAAAFPAWAQRPPSVRDPQRLILPPSLAMPGLERERQLRIYLPPSYATAKERRYPVVYFHDGQNLFDDATSYAGEWGADEILDELAARRGFEAIAVGIDNGGERRMRELNPWDHERFGAGEGFAYLRFLTEVVKPFVDQGWRTRPEAAHTALIGSSMGGLITHAALHRHSTVFGLGGVFSPSFWIAPQAYELALAEPLNKDQRVFLYGGGREGEAMLPDLRRMADLHAVQPAVQQVMESPQAGHNEAAWRTVLPAALRFLFQLDR